MEYIVQITELLSHQITIEASSAEEAKQKIQDSYYNDIDSDIFNAHDNNDGTIDYEVLYYNGGCSFDEAVEYAIDNMKSKIHK